MIVNIAGTSGAGKTTAVWNLMRATGAFLVSVEEGGRLVGHLLEIGGKRGTFLVGRYIEGRQTCGCDMIKDIAFVYDLVARRGDLGLNVVYEGIMMMNHTRGPALARARPGGVTVLLLTASLAECERSIDARRAALGLGPLADMRNVRGNHVRARNFAEKMGAAGARVIRVTRDEAPAALLAALE